MYSTAGDLRDFYDTVGGRVVQRIIRKHIRQFWPHVKGLRVAGLGYATPYLKPMMDEAERVIALMPQQQGAVHWPADEKNLVTLCDENDLPLETNSVDRLLIVHAVQSYDSVDAVLREAWRVLSGQGSLLLIVPNRTGIWARVDHTPFGHGVPYSMGQIRQVLKDYMFVPEKYQRALFVPPAASRLMLASSGVWENLGQRFFNAFGGINMVEATKQLYAGTLVGAASKQARPKLVTASDPL